MQKIRKTEEWKSFAEEKGEEETGKNRGSAERETPKKEKSPNQKWNYYHFALRER